MVTPAHPVLVDALLHDAGSSSSSERIDAQRLLLVVNVDGNRLALADVKACR